MSSIEEKLLDRQKKRYQFLMALYEAEAFDIQRWVENSQLGQKLGFVKQEVRDICQYLADEKLIKFATHQGHIHLTHRGIVEMENSIKNPKEGTEHFPAPVIQNFNAPVGTVQTGSNATATITQYFGATAPEVVQLLSQLRQNFQSLPEGNRIEAIEVIDGIEEEIQRPQPRVGRLKSFFESATKFAMETGQQVIVETLKGLITGQMGS